MCHRVYPKESCYFVEILPIVNCIELYFQQTVAVISSNGGGGDDGRTISLPKTLILKTAGGGISNEKLEEKRFSKKERGGRGGVRWYFILPISLIVLNNRKRKIKLSGQIHHLKYFQKVLDQTYNKILILEHWCNSKTFWTKVIIFGKP